MSTIPLAKGYSEKHLRFPVFLSHKLDGVPVRIDIDQQWCFTVRSRQNKPVPSVSTLVQEFLDEALGYFDGPCTLVGEVYQHGDPYADFKDTSGIVRRQDDQSHLLAIGLFEMFTPALQEVGFERRYEAMLELNDLHGRVSVMRQHRVETLGQLEQHCEEFCNKFPNAEGVVARNHDDPFMPGKRSWGYQKLLREPTIDLRIVDFEEATSEDGTPKGMVGRMVAMYKGTKIGIGPGRLTHAERIDLWNKKLAHIEKYGPSDLYVTGTGIAQIKYKKDESYEALRQPTFQHWRDDKSEPDA